MQISNINCVIARQFWKWVNLNFSCADSLDNKFLYVKNFETLSKFSHIINQSINQSNLYSANIPGEPRLSGTTAESVSNSKIEETVS